MKWQINLAAAFALFLLVQCDAKATGRKRRFTPVFEGDGNLSYKDCGRASPNARNIDEQFPWLVRILVDGRLIPTKCFGVVISNDTVLTSAFCVDIQRNDEQRSQKVLLTRRITSEDGQQTSSKIVHDDYKIAVLDNNIAVLKFSHNLLELDARPICLWNQVLEGSAGAIAQNDGIGTVIGMARGSKNFNLTKAEVKTGKPDECKKLIAQRHHQIFDNGHICAWMDSSQSECVGGFGAPLQFEIGGRWFLRGLYDLSYKAKDKSLPCYKSHVISFTDTARHVKFITQNAGIRLGHEPNAYEITFKGQYSYSGCGRNVARMEVVLSVGGQPADIREVPWTAALYTFKNKTLGFKCGGSLISTRFVLTAAHCIFERKDSAIPVDQLVVYLGKTSFNGDMTSDGGVISKNVESIMPYDGYNPKTNQHDIALIKLKSSVHLSTSISIVCLWSGSSEETFVAGKTGVMSGWGYVNTRAEEAKGLQKLSLPIVSKDKCRSITVPHAPDYYTTKMEFETLCAGYVNENKGPCNGDSGGPLVIKRGDRYFLRGLVSESVRHKDDYTICNPDYPAIFTDVALYRTWIKEQTGNELLNYDTTSRDF